MDDVIPTKSKSRKRKAIDRSVTATISGINGFLRTSRGTNFNVWKMATLLGAVQSAEYLSENMMAAKAIKSQAKIQLYALTLRKVRGLVLEFGVASGRSINRMAPVIVPEKIYGFDSFEGLPETWRPDHRRGRFAQPVPTVAENVELIVGWYNETLPRFLKTHIDNVSFLHVDCDLYSSTKTIFDALKDRIVPGTVILFDEYFNYPGWKFHETKAFKEFVADHGVRYRYVAFTPTNKQVAVIIDHIDRSASGSWLSRFARRFRKRVSV